jgi:hypothetical protein
VSVRVSVSVFFPNHLFTHTVTNTVFISRITRKGSIGKGLSVVRVSVREVRGKGKNLGTAQNPNGALPSL